MDTTISTTTPVCTATEFNEILGRADELVVEVEVEAIGGSPSIALDVYHSNSGKGFVAATSGGIIPTTPVSAGYRAVVSYRADVLAALVQLRVALTGTTPSIRIRIWACGRVH